MTSASAIESVVMVRYPWCNKVLCEVRPPTLVRIPCGRCRITVVLTFV